MRRTPAKRFLFPLSMVFGLLAATLCSSVFADPVEYTGMSDASAGVALSEHLFVAANDEDNTLRVYKRDEGGPPLFCFDLNPFLKPDPDKPEADLEGACQQGDRVYWITSHGRNKNGKKRPSRQRFFATKFKVEGDSVEIETVGTPYSHLLEDLLAEPLLQRFNLEEASKLAPKELGALNIEGLCPTPEGHLLLGFRNPIPGGKALVVPLKNPDRVVESSKPEFGEPVLLELGGLGIRELSQHEGTYLIVAGPYDVGGTMRLYRWAGPGAEPQELKTEPFGDLVPEGVIVYPDSGLKKVQLLSDDGEWAGRKSGGESFRSFWVDIGK